MRTWWLHGLVLGGVRLLLRCLGGYRARFEAPLPAGGPVIIAPNHRSHADPALVAVTFPRPLRYLATDELFAVPVLGGLCRAMGALPIRQDSADLGALRRALALLGAGEALVAFPEGHESPDGALLELQRGVLMLAQRSGAVVVPAGIAGTEEMVPPRQFGMRRARRRAVIVYGSPVPWDELSGGLPGRSGVDAARGRLAAEITRLAAEASVVRAGT